MSQGGQILAANPELRYSEAEEKAKTAANELAILIENINKEPHQGSLAEKRREELTSKNMELLGTRFVIQPDKEESQDLINHP